MGKANSKVNLECKRARFSKEFKLESVRPEFVEGQVRPSCEYVNIDINSRHEQTAQTADLAAWRSQDASFLCCRKN
jgi:hypothetical protein